MGNRWTCDLSTGETVMPFLHFCLTYVWCIIQLFHKQYIKQYSQSLCSKVYPDQTEMFSYSVEFIIKQHFLLGTYSSCGWIFYDGLHCLTITKVSKCYTSHDLFANEGASFSWIQFSSYWFYDHFSPINPKYNVYVLQGICMFLLYSSFTTSGLRF